MNPWEFVAWFAFGLVLLWGLLNLTAVAGFVVLLLTGRERRRG